MNLHNFLKLNQGGSCYISIQQEPYDDEGPTREGAKRACVSHASERTFAHTSSEARARAHRGD